MTSDCLKQIISGLPTQGTRALIVGLGNQEITAIPLGPMAAREVIVTAHLHRLNEAELAQGNQRGRGHCSRRDGTDRSGNRGICPGGSPAV